MTDLVQRLTESEDPLARMAATLHHWKRRLRLRVGQAPRPSPPRLKRSPLPKWKRT